MDAQQWLDLFARELRQRRIPPEYIARYVAEMNDHITDMLEERSLAMSKDALRSDPTEFLPIAEQIGNPGTLAEAAKVELVRRSFCGRHRVAMFLLAPIPLTVLAWAATFGACFGLTALVVTIALKLGADPSWDAVAQSSSLVQCLVAMLFVLIVSLPPTALTVLLCRLAQRSGLSWRWSLAACLMVALTAGVFQASLDPPVIASDEQGLLTLGLGLWFFPPVKQLFQFALPLTIGLGLLWRQAHRRDRCSYSTPQAVTENRQAA